MDPRSPIGGGGRGFGLGLTGPVPREVWILLGILFVTFTCQFFASLSWFPALLRLTPAVWRSGFVWQLVTYPFAGIGVPSLWFVLELLILFLFARDTLRALGRRRFWTLLLSAASVASVVAVLVQLLLPVAPVPFGLMQGQHMVVVILIAAFATLYADATILLFFVLPIQARWFLGLEILFAFMGFLGSKDLAGFAGICAAVGFTYFRLRRGRPPDLRELWLRLQERWIRLRLGWLKRRRGLRVVRGEGGDPWVHREGRGRGEGNFPAPFSLLN